MEPGREGASASPLHKSRQGCLWLGDSGLVCCGVHFFVVGVVFRYEVTITPLWETTDYFLLGGVGWGSTTAINIMPLESPSVERSQWERDEKCTMTRRNE